MFFGISKYRLICGFTGHILLRSLCSALIAVVLSLGPQEVRALRRPFLERQDSNDRALVG